MLSRRQITTPAIVGFCAVGRRCLASAAPSGGTASAAGGAAATAAAGAAATAAAARPRNRATAAASYLKTSWLTRVPRGIREFTYCVPTFFIVGWFIWQFDSLLPGYVVFDPKQRMDHTDNPKVNEYGLVPIIDPKSGTVTGYKMRRRDE